MLVLSALAEGGDQLVAEEALGVGARLVAPLPLPPELYVDDFDDAGVHATFESLRKRAEVVLLPRWMEIPRHIVGSPGAARDRQYAKAGVYIASHCHVLLALWDGNEANGVGGTAQIVHYHLTGGLPGPTLHHNRMRHVLAGGAESLLYHIVCPRAGEPVAAGLSPMEVGWRIAEDNTRKGWPPDRQWRLKAVSKSLILPSSTASTASSKDAPETSPDIALTSSRPLSLWPCA